MEWAENVRARPRRILVVEDDPDAGEILCAVLEILGHRCQLATSGRRALELAEELRPDVAFVDLGLPDMCGYDLGRALRVDPRSDAMHLIALTGSGGAEHRSRSLRSGFDQHLVKPISRRHLVDAIAGAGPSHSS